EQVSDQAGGDWLAAAVLLVLAGVRVEREDRRDPLRRAALQGVDHQQLLHQPVIQRLRVGLQDKSVGATDGLLEAHEDLAVGEVARRGRSQLDTKLAGYCLTQLRVCTTRKQHEVRSEEHTSEL